MIVSWKNWHFSNQLLPHSSTDGSHIGVVQGNHHAIHAKIYQQKSSWPGSQQQAECPHACIAAFPGLNIQSLESNRLLGCLCCPGLPGYEQKCSRNGHCRMYQLAVLVAAGETRWPARFPKNLVKTLMMWQSILLLDRMHALLRGVDSDHQIPLSSTSLLPVKCW